jgi:PKD repeat protein
MSIIGVADTQTSEGKSSTGILATSQTVVYVDPPNVTASVGQNITISVKIANVTNFYGFDIQFRWAPTILKHLSHSVRTPVETHPDGVLHGMPLVLRDDVNESGVIGAEVGTLYWLAVTQMSLPAFSGNGTIFTMTFRVLKEGECDLYFINIDLSTAPPAQPIPHETIDGLFSWPGKGSIPEIKPFSISPLVNVTGLRVFVNVTTTFNASDSFDPDGLPLSLYIWNFGDGTQENATGPLINHTYTKLTGEPSQPPNPVITLTVIDAEGSQSKLIYTVVRVVTPRPIALFSAWPPPLYLTPRLTTTVVDQIVYFDASASFHPKYPQSYIVHYEWNFGDGTPKINVTTPDITHIYNTTAEMYEVKLKVYDNNGIESLPDATNRDLYDIFVVKTRDLRVTNILVTPATVKLGQNATINATFSSLVTEANGAITDNRESFTAKAFYNATHVDPSDPLNVTATTWSEIASTDTYCNFNSSRIVSWQWNTTGIDDGTYWLKINITEVPYETNTTNNNRLSSEPLNITPEDVHDIAITELKAMVIEGAKIFDMPAITGEDVTIRVNVTARGNVPETFNLTLHTYAPNGTLLQTIPWTNITLNSGQTLSFTHLFETQDLSTGNFTAHAIATIAELDKYPTNNEMNQTFRVILPPVPASSPLPQTIRVGDTVEFDATPSYHPDGTIEEYTWNFSGPRPGGLDMFSRNGKTINYTFIVGQNSTWTVWLYLKDNYNITYDLLRTASKSAYGKSIVFTVSANLAPEANFTWSPLQLRINETVTFTSTSTDSGNITRYYWFFGDGTKANATVPYMDHNYTSAGTFNVTLTAEDNVGANSSITHAITVQRILSTIDLTVTPSTIQYGQTVTINGTVTPAKAGLNVTIKWNSTTIITRLTNAEGFFTYTWTPPKAGTYQITATWAGDITTEPAQSEVASLTVQKLTMTLTLDALPSTVKVGESVTINGTLSPLAIGANVNITIRINGTILATVQTDTNGKYIYTWNPDTAGTFEVKVEWAGNANSLAASNTKTVTVEAQPTDIILYAIIAAVVIIIIIVAVYLLKFRKK